MRFSILMSLAVIVPLSGCASTIAAVNSDPSRVHTLRPGRFFTITGERRLAFQVERYDKENPPPRYYDRKLKREVGRVAWCAESLPEASQALSATSKPSLALGTKLTAGNEEGLATTLVQTFTRTEIAELYRQMGWQACQAWAQGVYSDDHYAKQLDKLIDGGIAVVKLRAEQPLSPPAATTAEQAAAAKKQAEAEKCKKTPTAAECPKAPSAAAT